MSKQQNSFQVLSKINVEKDVKGKNGFKYLSWSSAVHHLLSHYPDSSWEHREWDGLPYLQSKAGCFVEVSVTINDITRKQLHPILDYRNQPIKEPNAFQINTSIQRALAKAIGLHGLGLYIYQGEDLPPSEKEAIESARVELSDLLRDAGKLNPQAKQALFKMSYEDIQNKIAEYRNKGESND
jgi:hypothetical protein